MNELEIQVRIEDQEVIDHAVKTLHTAIGFIVTEIFDNKYIDSDMEICEVLNTLVQEFDMDMRFFAVDSSNSIEIYTGDLSWQITKFPAFIDRFEKEWKQIVYRKKAAKKLGNFVPRTS